MEGRGVDHGDGVVVGVGDVQDGALGVHRGRVETDLDLADIAQHAQAIAPAGIAGQSYDLPGVYQLARPSWSFLAATSGVSVPLMTLADSAQVSFSRFGVPRERIW